MCHGTVSGVDGTMADHSSGADPNEALKRAFRAILRPLARLAVVRGLPITAVTGILKEVFVEAAVAELARRGEKRTQSRIAVLSGVHRKDVRAFLQAPAADRRRAAPSFVETVLGRWMGDPAYTDRNGKPLALDRTGEAPSFDALVAGVSTDVRPRTILEEMKRLGIVDHDPEADVVRLHASAFVPDQDAASLLSLFEANLADHASAAAANVMGRGPFLERAVYYTHLPPDAVDRLEAQARERSRETLETLNAEALAAQTTTGADLQRFRFGVYFFREPIAAAEGDPGPGDPDAADPADQSSAAQDPSDDDPKPADEGTA